MKDWSIKLDVFLKASDSNVLENLGNVSHIDAENKAQQEYELYKESHKEELTKVEKDFLDNIKNTQKMLEKEKNKGER